MTTAVRYRIINEMRCTFFFFSRFYGDIGIWIFDICECSINSGPSPEHKYVINVKKYVLLFMLNHPKKNFIVVIIFISHLADPTDIVLSWS